MDVLKDASRIVQDMAQVLKEGLTGADGGTSLGGVLVLIAVIVVIGFAVKGIISLVLARCSCGGSCGNSFATKSDDFIRRLNRAVESSWSALGSQDEDMDFELWRRAYLHAHDKALRSQHPVDDIVWPLAALITGLVIIEADESSSSEESVALVAAFNFSYDVLPERSIGDYAEWLRVAQEAFEIEEADGRLVERVFDGLMRRLQPVTREF